jgi:hypothetical protein
MSAPIRTRLARLALFALAGLGGLALAVPANAQVVINAATATGSVQFNNENVVGVTAGGPAFNGQNKLISPGQGYGNTDNAVANVSTVGPAAIVPPLNAAQGAAGQFGGSTLTVFGNNNGVWYSNPFLTDVPNNPTVPGPASVTFGRGSATFNVGANGFAGKVGSYFAIGGLLPAPQAGSYLAVSLVTQIDVFSPVGPQFNQSFFSRIWLGFDGQGQPLPDFIAGDGFNSPLNGNPVIQPTVDVAIAYTNGGNGFVSAASVTTDALFLAGTTFNVFTEVTMIANIGPGGGGGNFFNPPPGQVPNVIRPDFGGAGNFSNAPEPGTIALFLLGGLVVVARRRK